MKEISQSMENLELGTTEVQRRGVSRLAACALLLLGCNDPSPGSSAEGTGGSGGVNVPEATASTGASAPGEATGAEGGSDSSSGSALDDSSSGGDTAGSSGDEPPDRPEAIAPVGADWVSAIAGAQRTPTVRRRPGGAAVSVYALDAAEFGHGGAAPVSVALSGASTVLGLLEAETGAVENAVRLSFGAEDSFLLMPAMERMQSGDLILAGGWAGDVTLLPDSSTPIDISTLTLADTRAYDPLFLRLTPEADLVWWMRGRNTNLVDVEAPGVLQGGPAVSIEALDGDGIAVGGYQNLASSFVLGDGTTGATSLLAEYDSYVARIDAANGTPAWLAGNDGGPTGDFAISADSTAGGAVLMPVASGRIAMANTSDPYPVPGPIGDSSIARVTADGSIDWTIGLHARDTGLTAGFTALDSGEVLVVGYSDAAGLDVLSADGTMSEHAGPGHWIARFDDAGALLWIRSTPLSFDHDVPGVGRSAEFVPLVDGDSVWLAGSIGWPFEIDVGEERLALPDLELEEDDTVSVIQRFEPDGTPAEVRILGVNLYSHVSVDWADPAHDRIYVASSYRCNDRVRRVFSTTRKRLEALPSDCNTTFYGYAAAFSLM